MRFRRVRLYGRVSRCDWGSAGAVGDRGRGRRLAGDRREQNGNFDADCNRQRDGADRGEAGEGAERAAHRAISVMVLAVTVVLATRWRVFLVMPGYQRQQLPAKIMLDSTGIFAVRCVFEGVGEVEGEMNRDERIEAQRDHAEPSRDTPKPQPIWPHLTDIPGMPETIGPWSATRRSLAMKFESDRGEK